MNKLENILVVMGPLDRPDVALRRAVELARRSDALLRLCLFDHDPAIAMQGEALAATARQAAVADFLEERMQRLGTIAAGLAQAGLRVECEAVWAQLPHRAIVARTAKLKPDLVIRGLERTLRATYAPRPLDWRLLRLLPADLMLVRGDSSPLSRRILAAVDACDSPTHPWPLNRAIVGSARRLAEQGEASLHLAHVAAALPGGGAVDDALPTAGEAGGRDAEAFRRFAGQQGLPDDCCHLLSGEPAPAVLQLARSLEADLLVVGSIYRSAWDRFMLGATAEQLLAEADCDLLLVKEPGFPVRCYQ